MLRRHLLLPLVAAITLSACAGSSPNASPGVEAIPVGGDMPPSSVVAPTAPSTAATSSPAETEVTSSPVTVATLPGGQVGVPVEDQDAIDAWEKLLNDALSSDAVTLEFDARMALLDDADDTVDALSDLTARTDLPRVRFVASGARTLTADQCPVGGVDECVAVDAQLFGSGGDVIADQANAVVVKRDGTWFVGRPTVCWLLLLVGTACSR